MPKVAVLFTNHYRTFPLISNTIKEFYGPNVDFYASTWDHDHGNLTYNETVDLLKSNSSIAYNEWYNTSVAYMELNLQKVKNELKDFEIKDFIINSADEYDLWASQIQGFTYSTWWEKFLRFGTLYTKVKGWELIKSTGIHYDIIFYHRFDTLNFIKKEVLSNKHAFEKIFRKDWNNHLGVSKLSIAKGYVWVDDKFFYTSSIGSAKLFDDIINTLNMIISNPLFKDNAQSHFCNHKLLGTLIQAAKFRRLYNTPFDNTTIYKSTVLDGCNLNDFDSCQKHHELIKTLAGRGSEPLKEPIHNEWAEEFFKVQIKKYRGA